jgi:hypothetical protein
MTKFRRTLTAGLAAAPLAWVLPLLLPRLRLGCLILIGAGTSGRLLRALRLAPQPPQPRHPITPIHITSIHRAILPISRSSTIGETSSAIATFACAPEVA